MTKMPSVSGVFWVIALTVVCSGAAIVAAPARPQEKSLELRVLALEKSIQSQKVVITLQDEKIAVLEDEARRSRSFLGELKTAFAGLGSGVAVARAKGFARAAFPAASREELLGALEGFAKAGAAAERKLNPKGR